MDTTAMDWGNIAARFERDDAASDDSLAEYLVIRSIDKQASTGHKITITGPRGSGKSAMLRVVESSVPPSWLVARATYAELRDLASALREAANSASPREELARSVVFFWTIAVLASDSKGLTHGETAQIRKAGLEVGVEDPDFIENIAQLVRTNFWDLLGAFGTALGIGTPLPVVAKARKKAAMSPFGVLQRVLPALRKVLATRSVLLQVDEIDGARTEVHEISSIAFSYAEALDRLCAGAPTAKWSMCISSAVWAYVMTAGYNLKYFGSQRQMKPWSASELHELWQRRVDPVSGAAESYWRNLIPLQECFSTQASRMPSSEDGPSVYGCRRRLRTFVDLWARLFREAELHDRKQIDSVPDSVWSQHLSHTKNGIVSELAAEAGDVTPILRALGRTSRNCLDQEFLESMLGEIAGKSKGSTEPWLRMTTERLLELLAEAEILVKLAEEGQWEIRKELLV